MRATIDLNIIGTFLVDQARGAGDGACGTAARSSRTSSIAGVVHAQVHERVLRRQGGHRDAREGRGRRARRVRTSASTRCSPGSSTPSWSAFITAGGDAARRLPRADARVAGRAPSTTSRRRCVTSPARSRRGSRGRCSRSTAGTTCAAARTTDCCRADVRCRRMRTDRNVTATSTEARPRKRQRPKTTRSAPRRARFSRPTRSCARASATSDDHARRHRHEQGSRDSSTSNGAARGSARCSRTAGPASRGRRSTAVAAARRARRASSRRRRVEVRRRRRRCSRSAIQMVGPTIMAHGTDEQKAFFLPRMLSRRGHLVPAVLRAGRRFRPRRA